MLSSDWIIQVEPENGALRITFDTGYGLTAYHIKRERLQQAKSIPELKQCGIYFLYGETEKEGKLLRNVYVGQAVVRQNGEGIWLRIKEHLPQNYWTEAIACVSADDSWGPTELSYLENYFANQISSAKKDSKSYKIRNEVSPNPGNPTPKVKKRCRKFIDEAITILETLRYDFFKEEKLEQALLGLSPESPTPQQFLSKQAVDDLSHGKKSAVKRKVQQIQHLRPTHSKQRKKPAPASVLIVTFPDGTVIHEKNAAETLALTINRIGPKNVANLQIPADGGYLVSREGSRIFPESNYPLDDGFVLITHSSTNAKMDKLKKISKKLNLGLVVSKTPKHV